MKFSVIMPSHLEDYVHAAKYRVMKFHRAVKSVIDQTFEDWELIIVSDGCDKTMREIDRYTDERITVIKINKQEWKSQGVDSKIGVGAVRNEGIKNSMGEWIAYLDTDDFIGCNHLKHLNSGLSGYDWIWSKDYKWTYNREKNVNEWKLSNNSLKKPFHFGTANIAHKRGLDVSWPTLTKYGFDDLMFVEQLKKISNFAEVEGGQYFICHVPRNPIFPSYDI